MSATFSHSTVVPSPISGSAGSSRIALIDRQGTIVAVNRNWSDLANQTHATLSDVAVGVNYLSVCRRASVSCDDAREALDGIQSVLTGRSRSFVLDYSAEVDRRPAYFRMVVTPFCHGSIEAAIVHIDITKIQLSRKKSHQRARDYARRLISVQEQERERIAREIHDDLGNRIALLSFSVHSLMSRSGNYGHELSEVRDRIEDLSHAMRHLSHSLHPHLLRHFGIRTTLKVFCEEYGKACSIHIDVKVPDAAQLPEETSLCLFRVLQESLHNIAKHSAATSASVVLEIEPGLTRLVISDNGRGFVQEMARQKEGLGFTSMRERVLCIGGQLKIHSTPGTGTQVRVTIPMAPKEVGAESVEPDPLR